MSVVNFFRRLFGSKPEPEKSTYRGGGFVSDDHEYGFDKNGRPKRVPLTQSRYSDRYSGGNVYSDDDDFDVVTPVLVAQMLDNATPDYEDRPYVTSGETGTNTVGGLRDVQGYVPGENPKYTGGHATDSAVSAAVDYTPTPTPTAEPTHHSYSDSYSSSSTSDSVSYSPSDSSPSPSAE